MPKVSALLAKSSWHNLLNSFKYHFLILLRYRSSVSLYNLAYEMLWQRKLSLVVIVVFGEADSFLVCGLVPGVRRNYSLNPSSPQRKYVWKSRAERALTNHWLQWRFVPSEELGSTSVSVFDKIDLERY